VTYEGGAQRSVLLTSYSGDQIGKNEVGRARSTHGGEEKCLQGFGAET